MGSRGEVGRAWKLLVLIVAAGLLLFPASALAKKKHKKPKGLGPVVTATATGPTVTGPATSSASATCPSGLQAVGGGFSAPFNGTARLVVTESYRSSPDTWHVSAFNGSGVGAATAYAYCRRNNKVVTDVTATASVPSGLGGNGLAQALCAPGAVAISGGFQITNGPGSAIAIPMESIGGGPVPGGTPPVGYWDVVAQNTGPGAQTITAHVYCVAGLKLPAFKQDQTSAVVPSLGSLTESSSCPPVPKVKKKKGKKKKTKAPAQLLSAGAFYSPFIPGSTTGFPVYTDSRIVGTSIVATASNAGSGGSITVQSQAMCF